MQATIVPKTLAAEIAAGDRFNFSELSRKLNISPATVFRWGLRGLPDGAGGRAHLEAIHLGRVWLTSWGAYRRFLEKLPTTPASQGSLPAVQTPVQTQASAEAADELKRRGIH